MVIAKFAAGGAAVLLLGAGLFLFFLPREEIIRVAAPFSPPQPALPSVPESAPPAPISPAPHRTAAADAPPAEPLAGPPSIVKGIYATGWTAGSSNKIKTLETLISETELNAIVVDIKDYSGFVSYRTGIPEVGAAGAEAEPRIARPNALLADLHAKGIYVIGRIAVFQDPVLAAAHPEWALGSSSTRKTWTDRKGLSWMDPAAEPVWAYNAAIARDALKRGFDEINFDYVRFASDGDLADIRYPFWDKKNSRASVMKNFFAYLREHVSEGRISADLFGLSTINRDDLGIGQVIENAYAYFDYVSPMVYPSHYASGFLGFKNPAEHPFEVISYSMQNALRRLLPEGTSTLSEAASSTAAGAPAPSKFRAKLRPWLQDFDLGALYDAGKIKEEIRAVNETFATASSSGRFAGWLLWDPANTYTKGALAPST